MKGILIIQDWWSMIFALLVKTFNIPNQYILGIEIIMVIGSFVYGLYECKKNTPSKYNTVKNMLFIKMIIDISLKIVS